MPLPADPSLSLQWHLINSVPGALDLNVAGVWNPSDGPAYSGAGVTVAVTADSFEYSHPDLVGNYSTTLDYDFLNNDFDPFPAGGGLTGNDGTAHLGLIGAVDNSLHGVGVAYSSLIYGYGMFVTPAPGFMATWFSHLDQSLASAAINADIISMGSSLGSAGGMGFTLSASLGQIAALRADVDAAVDSGRGGLGLIITLGAGSLFSGQSDTNSIGQTNNTQQIVVTSIQDTGFATATSSQGASVLVSAFGQNLATTDRVGANGATGTDFNTAYTDDDAAAALVSGVVALMLDANDQLGWRDVQTILAYGARHVGTDVGMGYEPVLGFNENSAWFFNGAMNWNGGGLHYSKDYGFGLVDAHASVRLAETWFIGVGGTAAQTSANESALVADLLATDIVLDGSDSALTTTIAQNINVERVAVTLDFLATYLADVEITLVAPDGTRITMLKGQAGSADFDGVWTVETQSLRGISSQGDWQVIVSDQIFTEPTTFSDVQLTIYGSATVNDRYVFTDEYSDYGSYNRINTVVDTDGGTDVVNAAAVTSNSTIFLNGTVSLIDTMRTTFSGIENAIGGDGNDSIAGTTGMNELWGGRGRDSLRGEGGQDSLYGESGNDLLFGGDGNDLVQGGDGNDTLYGFSADAGSPVNDNDMLEGGAGNDFMYGGFGDDTFLMGTGNDYADGGIGFNIVSYASETSGVLVDLSGGLAAVGGALGDTLVGIGGVIGTSLSDALYGDFAANRLTGGFGIDLLSGGTGNDSLYGGGDNDIFLGGSGADLLDGGAGARDLAEYIGAAAGLRADLQVATFNTGDAAGDTYFGIEDLLGSVHGDTLLGDTGANVIFGGNGSDVWLDGRLGNDTLYGGSGNDVLIGGQGADFLDGELGTRDRVQYTDAAGLRADLQQSSTNTGFAAGDIYVEIEDLFGSFQSDSLLGDGGGNIIWGATGNDLIDGRLGNDTLLGGPGNDTITGGGGADVFLFESAVGATNVDSLVGYSVSDDVIHLENAIFTALTTAGALSATAFAIGGATTTAHRIIYNSTTGQLFYDADGSSGGAAVHFATLSTALAMTASEFLVV